MSDTETETMQDTTRGRGASFSAGECGTLEAWATLAGEVHGVMVESGRASEFTPEERAHLDALHAKCKRGAGL